MISFRLFLLILVTLISRECISDEPRGEILDSGLAVLGVVLGYALLGKVAAFSALRSGFSALGSSSSALGSSSSALGSGSSALGSGVGDHRDSGRLDAANLLQSSESANQLPSLARVRIVDRFLRNRKLIEFAWVASYPLVLWATGWVAWANSLGSQGLGDSLVLLLLFAPSLAFIALMELSAAQLEEILDGDHGDEKQRLTWGQIWRLRLRLGEMANLMMCLAPVLFIAIGSDLLGWFKLSETSRALVAMAVAMSGILLLYPIALARWMRVQSVGSEHPVGARIEQLRQQVGLGSIKVVIVRSNGRWHGAAVVGWLPQLRSLWLGDALIDKLEPEELDMVILHEIAHVKRRHFLWRMMPMLWAAGVGISYKLVVDAVLVSSEAWPFWITQGLGIVLASLVLIYGLGYSARACELDADWSACELAAAHCEWTRGSCIIAAAKMDQALSQILGDSKEASGRTWLHPSLQERSQSLTNASGMLEHRGAQNESIEVPA